MNRWIKTACLFTVATTIALFSFRATAEPTPPPTRTAESAVTPQVKDQNRHEQFLYRIKQGPIGLLFMGDSITDWWPRTGEFSWLKFAPYQPADFGISADKTEHVLWRITHGELDGIHPKVVVLMIGTNNIGNEPIDTPEWAANGVKKIVEVIHEKLPETKVLLLGVFPRDTTQNPRRAAVAHINAFIQKLDDGNKTRFIDITRAFLDEHGELPNDVMPDKLHPTAKGYDLWYDAMKPLLDEMMK